MKIYVMTDLEGVAGVMDFEQWCLSNGRYYDLAKQLLTEEVNAAVDGFFAGGADEIVVADGHGDGGIDITRLDPRVELMRGWPDLWPLNLNETYDGLAFVGQHAKAGTEFGHLTHTQNLYHLDVSINGVSIGEFGQLAMCASELGVRTFFGAGDLAFTREAQALVPGIETVSVKYGLTRGSGDEVPYKDYWTRNTAAVHKVPSAACSMIRAGAEKAMKRYKTEDFGIIDLKPPYEIVAKFRATDETGAITRVDNDDSSISSLLNKYMS